MNPPTPSTPSAQVPRWVIALASGILGLGAGYGVALLTADDTTSSAASDSTSGNDPRPVDNTPTTAPDDAFDTPPVLPEPEDFEIGLKVTSKQCFGSAGCNVEFKIDLDSFYTGDADLTRIDDPITVTYEIEGAEDAYVDSLVIDGGNVRYNPTGHVSTPSESTELSVKVTDVY